MICKHCGHDKPATEFGARKPRERQYVCKACRRVESGKHRRPTPRPCRICGGEFYAKGLCKTHYVSSPDGKAADKRRKAKMRQERIDAGVCVDCGWALPYNGTRCKDCAAAHAARDDQARVRQRYQERIAAGLCPRCGEPAESDSRLCQRHHEAHRKNNQVYRNIKGATL